MRIPYISLAAAGALALGGCAYGDMGHGLGLGYGDYGYGSPYYGYGYGSPYYGYGSYGGLGYGSPYGWDDDYYYSGTGIYLYDSYRRPHMWTDRQRSYWTTRQRTLSTTSGTRSDATAMTSPNWSRFDRRSTSYDRQVRRQERQ